MKVKDLKKGLENVDDELDVVGYQHGMEQSGLLPVSAGSMRVVAGEMVERETWDRFDGTDYKYNVFEEKKGGSIKVFQLY